MEYLSPSEISSLINNLKLKWLRQHLVNEWWLLGEKNIIWIFLKTSPLSAKSPSLSGTEFSLTYISWFMPPKDLMLTGGGKLWIFFFVLKDNVRNTVVIKNWKKDAGLSVSIKTQCTGSCAFPGEILSVWRKLIGKFHKISKFSYENIN